MSNNQKVVPVEKAKVGDVVEIGGARCRVEEDHNGMCYGCVAEYKATICKVRFCVPDRTPDGLPHKYIPIEPKP